MLVENTNMDSKHTLESISLPRFFLNDVFFCRTRFLMLQVISH